MSAASITAAEAIRDLINEAVDDGQFEQRFRAVRGIVPDFVLQDAAPKGLQVWVCPTTHGQENYTRGDDLHTCGVVVSVIKKLDAITNEAIDPLIELVETIKKLVSGTFEVEDAGGRAAGNLEREPLYRPEYLQVNEGRPYRVFWGLFTVTVVFPR